MNDTIEAILRNRWKWLEDHIQETGSRAIGYTCRYVPVEIIAAAGFMPVYIHGVESPVPAVNNHLQSYCCHVVKHMLSLGLEKEIEVLDGVIFAHSCDALQSLADIFAHQHSGIFTTVVNMPSKLESGTARRYLIRELEDFIQRLEAWTGHAIDPIALSDACKQYNTFRKRIRRLAQHLRSRPVLTGREFQRVLNALPFLPVNDATMMIEEILASIESSSETVSVPEIRVVLSGARHSDVGFLEILDQMHVRVVADDSCMGQRWWQNDVPDLENPVEGIAERLLASPACACKHTSGRDRADELIALAREAKADGVIFYLYKYCDPYFSDYPMLKPALEQAGLPVLLLEVEKPGMNYAQFMTRLQAFSEMLAHG